MSTATSEGGLQVSCAQPDCHWKGPAADAPSHDCPTPAQAAPPAPFAGITGQDGVPIADELADTDLPYHVIWTGEDGTIVRVGTAATEDGALEIEQMTEKGKGSIEVRYIGEPGSGATVIDEAFEPETHGDVAAWLANWGKYTDAGVPEDEKTARLDAKLTSLEGEGDEEPGGGQPAPDPEPELEEDEPERLAAEANLMDPPPPGGDYFPPDAEEAWEVKVATTLEQQGQVAAYRWLIVDTDAGELIGRAKVKKEGEELLANVKRQAAEGLQVELVKTQDVLARAEELQIERKRQMVPPDEPAQTPASPEPAVEQPDPEPEPDEPEKPEGLKNVKPPAGSKKEQPLFDPSDFDREDLALPKVDGHSIDKIALTFSGTVLLDRGNPDHVALFRRAKIDADLELWIQGHGSGVTTKPNTNKDGDLDVVVSTRGLMIRSVRVVPAEGLDDLKDELAAQARDAHEAGEDAPA